MALRDQPYFPLYAQDFLSDEKLNLCSASAQGVFIKLMCIFHKSDTYGGILFKQKDKQKESIIENFAIKFAKLLPFDSETIKNALDELVDEGVLNIDGDFIFQKRMVRDGELSLKRSKAAKDGGGNPFLFKQNNKQEFKQNTKQIHVYENVNEDVIVKEKIKNMCEFFKFSEMSFPQQFFAASEFINCLVHRNMIEHFDKQFASYRQLKIKDGFKHSFKKFIGTPELFYEDGAWNSENWESKAGKTEVFEVGKNDDEKYRKMATELSGKK